MRGFRVTEDPDHPTATYRASRLTNLTVIERMYDVRDEFWAETLPEVLMLIAAEAIKADMIRRAAQSGMSS
jgi:hypothetical protein